MLSKLKLKLDQLKSKKVVHNMILVTSISFLISLLGFFKEAITAAYFGLSLQLDTFFVAILIPGLINTVFIGSYSSVFVPNYINEVHIGGNIRGFQSTSFLITIGISLFFVLFSFLGTDFFLEYMYPDKSLKFYSLVKIQFYAILPSIFFWGLSSLLGALLNINNEYKWTSFSGIFTPLIFIISIWSFKEDLPDTLLAWSTTIGAILSTFYLLTIAFKKNIIQLGKIDFNNNNIKIIFQQLPAKISSGLLTALNSVVDQFFAVQLIVGSITALNYGLKVPAFATSLMMIAFSNVLLPFFTKSILSNRNKSFFKLFKNVKWIFLILLGVSLIGIFLSDFIVSVLFERQEFTEDDTKLVSKIQQIFLVYVPFKIVGSIFVNFAVSLNQNKVMAYFSFFALILNLFLDYIFIQYYGIYGIALCTTIVISFKTIGMYIFLKKLSLKESA